MLAVNGMNARTRKCYCGMKRALFLTQLNTWMLDYYRFIPSNILTAAGSNGHSSLDFPLCFISAIHNKWPPRGEREIWHANCRNQELKALIETWRKSVTLPPKKKRPSHRAVPFLFVPFWARTRRSVQKTRRGEIVYSVNGSSAMDADSVWPPAGAKVRPPWRGKTLVFLFSFPTFHAALAPSKVERMIGSRAEAITPHTSSPESSASLTFFKEGK